jgi:hypothetical protein
MLSDTPDLHRIMQVNELSGVGGEKGEEVQNRQPVRILEYVQAPFDLSTSTVIGVFS